MRSTTPQVYPTILFISRFLQHLHRHRLLRGLLDWLRTFLPPEPAPHYPYGRSPDDTTYRHKPSWWPEYHQTGESPTLPSNSPSDNAPSPRNGRTAFTRLPERVACLQTKFYFVAEVFSCSARRRTGLVIRATRLVGHSRLGIPFELLQRSDKIGPNQPPSCRQSRDHPHRKQSCNLWGDPRRQRS